MGNVGVTGEWLGSSLLTRVDAYACANVNRWDGLLGHCGGGRTRCVECTHLRFSVPLACESAFPLLATAVSEPASFTGLDRIEFCVRRWARPCSWLTLPPERVLARALRVQGMWHMEVVEAAESVERFRVPSTRWAALGTLEEEAGAVSARPSHNRFI